eukprot:6209079-Pleurochrysis_carterae.AAC.5
MFPTAPPSASSRHVPTKSFRWRMGAQKHLPVTLRGWASSPPVKTTATPCFKIVAADATCRRVGHSHNLARIRYGR